jgi:hypothetical protein
MENQPGTAGQCHAGQHHGAERGQQHGVGQADQLGSGQAQHQWQGQAQQAWQLGKPGNGAVLYRSSHGEHLELTYAAYANAIY